MTNKLRLQGFLSCFARRACPAALCGATVLGWVTHVAHAVPLAVGANQLAVGEPDPTGGVVVAGGVPQPFATATYSGFLTTFVIAGDPSNPLGGMTFEYLLTNDAASADSLHRLTVNGYNGFATDVSFQTPVPAGAIAPTTNDRTSGPDVVGFQFVQPNVAFPAAFGLLAPGATSALMVVQTASNDYKPTTANVIDGTIFSVSSFAPHNTIPEPSTLVLAGLGVAGVALAARRTRRAS